MMTRPRAGWRNEPDEAGRPTVGPTEPSGVSMNDPGRLDEREPYLNDRVILHGRILDIIDGAALVEIDRTFPVGGNITVQVGALELDQDASAESTVASETHEGLDSYTRAIIDRASADGGIRIAAKEAAKYMLPADSRKAWAIIDAVVAAVLRHPEHRKLRRAPDPGDHR